MAADLTKFNRFVLKTAEREDLNQYWYSPHTIATLAKEVERVATRVAFLSTPSVFFSLKDKQLKERSHLLDLDDQWSSLPNFSVYDFNKPEELPKELHHQFDCVVIDPPFITEEVWAKYCATAKLLLPEHGGKVILTTIAENKQMLKCVTCCMIPICSSTPLEWVVVTTHSVARVFVGAGRELFGVEPCVFQPSIPHLVYQYCCYANFQTGRLAQPNPELAAHE